MHTENPQEKVRPEMKSGRRVSGTAQGLKRLFDVLRILA
jgi:hypothetical protein